MASYYISTDDGRVHHISDVTATPTIVINDGVATMVFDGVYRDVFPYPQTGANVSTTFAFGPGWVGVPDQIAGPAWDYSGADNIIKDDVTAHTAPRYLEVKKSFWKFVTADGAYFFPIERVVGMSNTAPTY